MLQTAKIIQVVNAGAMPLFLISLGTRNLVHIYTILRFLFILFYFIASFYVLRDKRWAWICSIVILVTIWLKAIPNLVINAHEYVYGQLYQDSPGTIFILLLYLIPTVFIPSIIMLLMFLRRHEIKASLSS